MCRLHKVLTGESVRPVSLIEENVYPAGSCGCPEHGSALMRRMKKDLSEQLFYQDMFRNSGMQETLSTAEDLQDFLMRLTRVEYLIRGLHTIHYFICDDWDGVNNQTSGDYRSEGYSDRLIVHTHSPLNGGSHCQIHRSKLIEYITDTNEPTTSFLLPIHYEDRAFGFMCMRFTESRYAPDALCWSWIELLNNALETLRIRSYLIRFSQRRHLSAIRDNLTGFYNRRGFEEISAEMYEYAVIHREKLLLCAVKLYNLSEASEVLGYEQTDEAIIAVSEVISRYLQGNEQCCRVQDGLFWSVGTHPTDKHSSAAEHKAFVEDCRKQLAAIDENNLIQIDIAAFFEQTGDRSLESILNTLEIKLNKNHLNDRRRELHIENIHELRKSFYKHPEQRWTIDEMARSVSLSRTHFQRIYRQTFGVSAASDLINARLTLAKDLLLLGNSIAETSSLCGYSSDVYFMHQFKKLTGLTPSEWLDQQKNTL